MPPKTKPQKDTMTSSEISEMYGKLSSSKKLEILWDALDYMQQHNGRSKFECVALALGWQDQDCDGIYEKY